jgi:cytochrome bd-type quinol oxidase subunit 1
MKFSAKPLRFTIYRLKSLRLRMSEGSQSGFWVAILIGGMVIAAASAFQQYSTKPEQFNTKPVIRDFCIGAFLTAMIYMFVPDTIQNLLSSGHTALSSFTQSPAVTASADVELQTGPARF